MAPLCRKERGEEGRANRLADCSAKNQGHLARWACLTAPPHSAIARGFQGEEEGGVGGALLSLVLPAAGRLSGGYHHHLPAFLNNL